MRVAIPAPMARIALDWTWGSAVGVASNAIEIWPAIRSPIIGAEPRYGTWTMSRPPANALNCSPQRWRIEPRPEEPKVYFPGLAFTRATRLFTSVAGIVGFTPRSVGVTPTCPIGAKSRTGSYGIFLYSPGLMAWVETVAISSV